VFSLFFSALSYGAEGARPLDDRRIGEQASNPYLILPHKPNYLMPFSWGFNPNNAAQPQSQTPLKHPEIKFQISLKARLGRTYFDDKLKFYAAYTNRSWWQAYNERTSRPFRETNHEPEIFATWSSGEALGFDSLTWGLGLNHQSNGGSVAESRSWNRLIASATLEKWNWVIIARPWWRLPEDEKESPDDPKGDDNPDIHRFLGYGELTAIYRLHSSDTTISVMVRNNLSGSNNRHTTQLGLSFPVGGRFRGYMEYFDGYGESLIDYNHDGQRLGMGILLTDWL
jgi:phospholipase A1